MLQTFHHPIATKPLKGSAGFSLVEIMVAMVIGLLGMLIMLQVYSNSEAQKRTTAGGDDAQNAGAIALYGLQRDIQQSGWGISSINLLGCNALLRAGVTLNAIAPVTINHASTIIPAATPPFPDANTDTLVIVSGNGNGGQEGVTVASQLGPSTIYTVESPNEFAVNDRIIARTTALPAACTLDTVTAVDVPTASVTVTAGLTGMTSGKLFNLGQTQKIRAYAIRDGNLTMCDYTVNDCGSAANLRPVVTAAVEATIWVPIASNIVSLKAQYGRNTAADPMVGVDTYDKTTPATANCWINTSSIRIALVARNSQSVQTGVTAAAPVWAGSSAVAASADPVPANPTADPINLTLNPDGTANANWQNYRYKVFQTIVPIRNITVQGAQTGC